MKRIEVQSTKKQKLVLVGNGMSGFKFCEKCLKYGVNKKYELVVFGEEYFPAYDRVNLTRYLQGTTPGELYLAPVSWYSAKGITLYTNEKVTEINTAQKWVKTNKGKTEPYDKLVFATGSLPYLPAQANLQKPGVFVYRTLKDLDEIKKYCARSKHVVIAGGGVLGLEAAGALLQMGLRVTITERNGSLMSKQLDDASAGMLKKAVETAGIKVYLNTLISLLGGDLKVETVVLSTGESLQADMVIFIAGIIPNDILARNTGIVTADSGGIVVNNYGLTSDESVFAIGECVSSYGRTWGLVLPCFEMAEVLAARFGGVYKAFSGTELYTKLKMPGINLVCFGDSKSESNIGFSVSDIATGTYKRLNTDITGTYLTGGILLGDISMFLPMLQIMRNKSRIGSAIEMLQKNISPIENGMQSMPDNTKICHCTGVTKGTIMDAIKNYSLSQFNEVRLHTGAGTGCESCTTVIDELLEIATNQLNSE